MENNNINALIDAYYNYVYTIIMNLKSSNVSKEDVEEIISDVFMAIWLNREKLQENTNIKAYLAGTTRNILNKKYRTITLTYPIEDYEETIIDNSSIDKLLEEKEKSNFIAETLKNVTDEEYQIFVMFYYDGKKIKDIAKMLEISVSKVKVKLHRIRKKVKRKLKEGGYSYEP